MSAEHDGKYYAKCAVGGALACGLTHAAVTPLDNVKCNLQVDPKKYINLKKGFSILSKEQGFGAAGLFKGWMATLIGYSIQGTAKFGLYEFGKDVGQRTLGDEAYEKYKPLVWCAASASAELVADIGLCPFEMLKVKQQTAPKGTFPTQFSAAVNVMAGNAPKHSWPYGSYFPLAGRQVPYTVVKFVSFSWIQEKIVYGKIMTKPKEQYTSNEQLAATFGSGYAAGVFCAIVSQPADNLVSLKSKTENVSKSFGLLIAENGWAQLATRGLGPRIIMIGTLTGLQWYIFDAWKIATGITTVKK